MHYRQSKILSHNLDVARDTWGKLGIAGRFEAPVYHINLCIVLPPFCLTELPSS